MAITLPQEFDKARDEASFNAARQEQFVLDQGRDDNPDKGVGSVTLGGAGALQQAAQLAKAEEKRQKDNVDTQVLLASQRLGNFESNLEAQYGENFDLDLLGDLVEQGKFTQEEYEKFASIEDKNERRIAVAEAIQEKIDAGEIDPADLKDHEWAGEWLDLHEEATAERDHDKQLALDGQKSEHDIGADAKDEAAAEILNADVENKFETASVDQEKLNNTDQFAQNTIGGFGIGGV